MNLDLALLLDQIPTREVVVISLTINGFTPREIAKMYNTSSDRVIKVQKQAIRRMQRIVKTDFRF